MPSIFDRVSSRRPRMSSFDLSREQKLSCKIGRLIPTYIDEVVPGDQLSVRTEIMMRLAPMISPVMHRVNVYMHYFFVPNRIIWPSWEDFITGGQHGTTEPVFPKVNVGSVPISSLRDYIGLPHKTSGGATLSVSALPFRAYQQIWNDYYRDPNLADEINVQTASSSELIQLRQRCWEKDYLTSALPFPQRGPGVSIPVDGLEYHDVSSVVTETGVATGTGETRATAGSFENYRVPTPGGSHTPGRLINLDIDNLDVDINDLRTSSALQRWMEKQARGGYRYIETILSHFGRRVPDHRLQRPEYLGGGRQPVVISEVLNTSATDTQPQGEMSGHGIVSGHKNTFKKQFDEHGYVMGIMSVLPRTAYQQGIHRHWSREDKHDFYWPEFANLGEQEIKNKEVYYDDSDSQYSEGTFGYQQRYAEYKYGSSTVHGDFRENLDFWHMGRIFDDQPHLNEEFVTYPETDSPDERVFAVPGQDPLWVQMYHSVKARRPMPYFADPRLS